MQDDFAAIFGWDEDEKSTFSTLIIIEYMSSLITSICSLGSACGAIGVGLIVNRLIFQSL